MASPSNYAPALESLREHPVPEWYEDAKLGIFIHWSLSSIPAFATREHDIGELLLHHYDDFLPHSPYAEWYENSIRFPDSPAARYHRENYGDRPYADFQRDFEAGLEAWDPADWADRFARAGARYVVLVTKHHDGYCLWPTRVTNPNRPGWCSKRDCVSELASAVRAHGMRFGVYYSGGIDWSFNPEPVRTLVDFTASLPRGPYPAYAEAQVRELIGRVAPDVLWNDISWPTTPGPLYRLIADYYNAVPEGLVNDRWFTDGLLMRSLRLRPVRALAHWLLGRAIARGGAGLMPPAPPHYDTRTPEYTRFREIRKRKWECVRGMDKSFGFNRQSEETDFLSRSELIESFVDIVSKNGNLLLNVGPRGVDAAIPDVQQTRLDWLGKWLDCNGEAIFGTRPWTRAEGSCSGGGSVRFTRRAEHLYALILGGPALPRLVLQDVHARPGSQVELLGAGPVRWSQRGDDLELDVNHSLPESPAYAFRVPL